ncbi:hypothetical protein RHMOL_Rhmol09G0199200 [Rhododendron molle]|uniref:Uncharacterized protein n=1 Tax=Rhododendron molle TaxID=49168 RepID=A0ACC0MGG5_RHOML|nr:hypothetical protein RHMOL_Rhmol09G0199200 [Rhododendron molle]
MIQESLGRSYSVPDDIDENPWASLTLWKLTWAWRLKVMVCHLYLQPDKESDLDAELNLPSAPSGNAVPAGRANTQFSELHWNLQNNLIGHEEDKINP